MYSSPSEQFFKLFILFCFTFLYNFIFHKMMKRFQIFPEHGMRDYSRTAKLCFALPLVLSHKSCKTKSATYQYTNIHLKVFCRFQNSISSCQNSLSPFFNTILTSRTDRKQFSNFTITISQHFYIL